MDKPTFFDQDEHPNPEQEVAGTAAADLIDEIASWPAGSGKTWMLNRVARYIERVDPRTEPLDG